MSHDLKTPLNAIQSYTQLLTRDLKNCALTHFEEYLHIIDNNSVLLYSMIMDILDLSQIKQGKIRLN